MQDIWLMTGTVRQNIALGSHSPADERIIQVSRTAGVHDFISAHPQGYQLKLGERGEGLSGGQRQAITIARALVGAPPILLLDEPTSAMDVNAERQLIERLKTELGKSTLIVITHKASLLELVDRVIVLDQGKVVADGPRDKVLGAGAGGSSGSGAPGGGGGAPVGPATSSGGGSSPPAASVRAAANSASDAAAAARSAVSGRAAFHASAASGGALQVVVPSAPAVKMGHQTDDKPVADRDSSVKAS
jgi:hypothetical protein